MVFRILQESVKSRLELMHLQRLREYIRKLKLRRYRVQAHVAVLDRLMCEVLRISMCLARSRPPIT